MGDRSKDLIPSLVRGLSPVAPVRLGPMFIACLLTQLGLTGAGLLYVGLRPDLAERAQEPFFIALALLMITAAAVCASTAIRLATPGRDVSQPRMLLLLALPLALVAIVLTIAPWGGQWHGWGELMDGCWPCIAITTAAAAVPWIATVMLVSRLAPLREWRVGVFAGLSAFILGALVTELHCANGDAYHLALGHFLPIAVLAAATSSMAAAFLRFRMRARSIG